MTLSIVILLVVKLLQPMTDARPDRPFTAEEAGPLLHVVSRLGTVKIVPPSPYFSIGWPHLCWLDSPEFFPLNRALIQYQGGGYWLVLSDLPRACLYVQPNISLGEVPLEEPSESFRRRMVEKILDLAAFLETELELRTKPPLGIKTMEGSLELPLIEDHDGPGGGVLLVADPAQFVQTRTATSPFDRAIHFWITTEEADELYHTTHSANDDRAVEWPLLAQVAEPYTPVAIAPARVDELAAECKRLASTAASAALKEALKRILSVCRSATNYHLGIYVPSP